MKKFTFKGVLDGFRSSVQAAPRGTEQEIQETLRPDHFQIKKELDIPRTISMLHQQRANLIQNVHQYKFLHQLLLQYLKQSRLI